MSLLFLKTFFIHRPLWRHQYSIIYWLNETKNLISVFSLETFFLFMFFVDLLKKLQKMETYIGSKFFFYQQLFTFSSFWFMSFLHKNQENMYILYSFVFLATANHAMKRQEKWQERKSDTSLSIIVNIFLIFPFLLINSNFMKL